MIPDRMRKRAEAHRCFADVCRTAHLKIDAVIQRYPDLSDFADWYSFHTVPGGRWGGHQKDALDIFYGSRPVSEQTVIPSSGYRKQIIAESGVQISYRINLQGVITVELYPAFIASDIATRKYYIIERIYYPSDLNTKFNRHLRIINHIMQATAIDGNYSVKSRLLCAFLKSVCINKVEGVELGRPINEMLRKIAGWFMFVGLSGCIITFYGYLTSSPPAIIHW